MEKMNQNIAVTIACPGPIQTDFLAESFTDKVGQVSILNLMNVTKSVWFYQINLSSQKYGQQTEIASNKLSAARCGKLFASALANRLDEVWIGQASSLQLTYAIKYYPNLSTL